jgi:hypothetical protein
MRIIKWVILALFLQSCSCDNREKNDALITKLKHDLARAGCFTPPVHLDIGALEDAVTISHNDTILETVEFGCSLTVEMMYDDEMKMWVPLRNDWGRSRTCERRELTVEEFEGVCPICKEHSVKSTVREIDKILSDDTLQCGDLKDHYWDEEGNLQEVREPCIHDMKCSRGHEFHVIAPEVEEEEDGI